MTQLILIRHGNTFGRNDKVIWAGARTDLPLVKKGRQQADQIGRMLAASSFKPDKLLTGPLIRTRQHALTIARHIWFAEKLDVEASLCEIDYGSWEGLSTAEIEAQDDDDELAGWNTNAIWPQAPGWSPSEDTIKRKTGELLAALASDTDTGRAILVTSNGILRFFGRLCDNPPEANDLKVRTGHYCMMHYNDGTWSQSGWNLPPDARVPDA